MSRSWTTKRRTPGVSTYATSLSERSSTSTPAAVRQALERYSTWSFHGRFDLAENVVLVDHGDVEEPDGEGGHERVADALAKIEKFAALTVVLAGTTRPRGTPSAPSPRITSTILAHYVGRTS